MMGLALGELEIDEAREAAAKAGLEQTRPPKWNKIWARIDAGARGIAQSEAPSN